MKVTHIKFDSSFDIGSFEGLVNEAIKSLEDQKLKIIDIKFSEYAIWKSYNSDKTDQDPECSYGYSAYILHEVK